MARRPKDIQAEAVQQAAREGKLGRPASDDRQRTVVMDFINDCMPVGDALKETLQRVVDDGMSRREVLALSYMTYVMTELDEEMPAATKLGLQQKMLETMRKTADQDDGERMPELVELRVAFDEGDRAADAGDDIVISGG